MSGTTEQRAAIRPLYEAIELSIARFDDLKVRIQAVDLDLNDLAETTDWTRLGMEVN